MLQYQHEKSTLREEATAFYGPKWRKIRTVDTYDQSDMFAGRVDYCALRGTLIKTLIESIGSAPNLSGTRATAAARARGCKLPLRIPERERSQQLPDFGKPVLSAKVSKKPLPPGSPCSGPRLMPPGDRAILR